MYIINIFYRPYLDQDFILHDKVHPVTKFDIYPLIIESPAYRFLASRLLLLQRLTKTKLPNYLEKNI